MNFEKKPKTTPVSFSWFMVHGSRDAFSMQGWLFFKKWLDTCPRRRYSKEFSSAETVFPHFYSYHGSKLDCRTKVNTLKCEDKKHCKTCVKIFSFRNYARPLPHTRTHAHTRADEVGWLKRSEDQCHERRAKSGTTYFSIAWEHDWTNRGTIMCRLESVHTAARDTVPNLKTSVHSCSYVSVSVWRPTNHIDRTLMLIFRDGWDITATSLDII